MVLYSAVKTLLGTINFSLDIAPTPRDALEHRLSDNLLQQNQQ